MKGFQEVSCASLINCWKFFGMILDQWCQKVLLDPFLIRLCFDDSAEFNYHSSSSKTKSIHTNYKDVKIQDNMDGQMDQAGIKSRNLGEILQMYFIYVQVANRMFWLMSSITFLCVSSPSLVIRSNCSNDIENHKFTGKKSTNPISKWWQKISRSPTGLRSSPVLTSSSWPKTNSSAMLIKFLQAGLIHRRSGSAGDLRIRIK